MLQIYTWPAKCLTTKSTPVDLEQGLPGHPDLEKFERNMIALMITAKGIGLSANQIGITKRFFCIGHESFDVFSKPVIIWNPQIKRISEETIVDVEGCLSFPNIWIKVDRPKKVTVSWQNMKGETLLQHLDGMESKCFQHELDHVDGITFNTRVSKLKWEMAKKKASKI
ncbi:MAG TPA: peptide deformylase [Flavobacteriaceae bacterium]|nr:peptide deformylase [Flavobacteriaceae bacterium]